MGIGFGSNAGAPALELDFTSGNLDPRIAASGGANGTRFDATGTLVAATCPRFDFDPITLAAKGVLSEKARTNSIRNAVLAGASPGSPGTMATNTATTFTANAGTLARTVVGSGTVNGIPYQDVQFAGLPTGAGQIQISLEAGGIVTASVGQVWALSSFLQLIANPSAAGLGTTVFMVNERNAGFLQAQTSSALSYTSAALAGQRITRNLTLANAGTTNITPILAINYIAGAVDITVRVGVPQLELVPDALSAASTPILTSGAALTRSEDFMPITGANFSSWFKAGGGTFVAQFDSFAPNGTGFNRVFEADDGTVDNVIALLANNGVSSQFFADVVNATVTQATLFTGSLTANVARKVAFAYAAADFALSDNGGAVTTVGAGTLPTVNALAIGNQSGGGGALNGHIQSLKYYPTRLTNAQLQALST